MANDVDFLEPKQSFDRILLRFPLMVAMGQMPVCQIWAERDHRRATATATRTRTVTTRRRRRCAAAAQERVSWATTTTTTTTSTTTSATSVRRIAHRQVVRPCRRRAFRRRWPAACTRPPVVCSRRRSRRPSVSVHRCRRRRTSYPTCTHRVCIRAVRRCTSSASCCTTRHRVCSDRPDPVATPPWATISSLTPNWLWLPSISCSIHTPIKTSGNIP